MDAEQFQIVVEHLEAIRAKVGIWGAIIFITILVVDLRGRF